MPTLSGGERREMVALAACLAAAALLLAFGDRLGAERLAGLEAGLLWPANQARDAALALARGSAENQALKQEVLRLRSEAVALRQAAAEAEQLRRALGFAAAQGPVLVPAQVTAEWGEPWPQFIRLSAGSRDGVRVGQPVVAPEGLVGRVTQVEAASARAAVLTDPALAIACEVAPGGARGVLRFRAERAPGLYLSWVPLTDTVRVGQEVATSGLSALFPRGLPVGKVAHVARDASGLVQEIRVRPYADVGRLRGVFVVVDTEQLVPWSPVAAESAAAESLRSAVADSLRGAARADSLRADSLRAGAATAGRPAAPAGGPR